MHAGLMQVDFLALHYYGKCTRGDFLAYIASWTSVSVPTITTN